jgi:inosose dehydratase
MSDFNRRQFLTVIGAASIFRPKASIFRLKPEATEKTRSVRLQPEGKIRVGYAAITWGGKDEQAIDEVAEAGYKGIQLRGGAFDTWGAKPEVLRALLEKHGLTFAVLSSGNLKYDAAAAQQQLELHASHAKFVRDAGGQMLQVIDEKPKDHTPGPDDFKRLGALMSELGRRTAAIGVPLVYHHHMNSTGEPPDAIDAIMAASDPASVWLLFDIAHYAQGGGDPVNGIRHYAKRLKAVHLKDVRRIDAPPGYQWVELGRGRVDVKGCVTALEKASYEGWAIVELDRVVDPDGTPKASAIANREYVVKQLGLKL